MQLQSSDYSNSTVVGPEARVAPRLLGWNVPAEELIHIPDHWLSYPEPSPLLNYVLGLLYIMFMLVALLGNGLVIWIFSSAKSLRTPSNMFVVNLAICDFLMMLKTPIFIYNSFNTGYALGHLGCQVFAFIGSISGIGAATTNAAIAYDRYRVIARPFDGKLTTGTAVLFVLLIWAYTLPWAIVPLLEIWSRFAPEGYLTSCTFDYLTSSPSNQMFVLTIFVFSYVIPMSLIMFFYSQIVSHVVSHEKSLREQAKKMNVESLRSNTAQNQTSAEIRIAKAAIGICFLFVASWTPYAVMALIGAFGNKALLTPGVTMIPACTCKAVACLDPYVYAISHPRYRVELQKRLPWLCIKENQQSSDTTSTVTATSTGATTTPS
ncbi:opsin, ultraviolet-sensitive [Schistocerca americana]|uniref:UV-sensitive opsin n=1 Tax=Schistocerca gregaria TaxID=7010 RepID=A0A077JDA4_SCHGR|nr:opsin, ultraviolet-sensitive [Schistocerca americana]XP_047112333.1 opsin, ultraviolet-sensitive [Schistocerca piceifrons]XP_049778813.1 opsin, ultraviolet-sensitive [Schistocerca cancellata]XP_049809661.1 opsin, ultraviolet-sensitive [Schistocerca nitens]XP_049860406.1 opsin, ultraviolet-sensitive [Schistocerca gregaria]XP_049956215.1 opsin, ultraviolet-sensitive [Schistocerca serialis cubense]BAP16681.1 UV-sensitive opsin [Schistocerca gregaria]